jgi:hypothetical protein
VTRAIVGRTPRNRPSALPALPTPGYLQVLQVFGYKIGGKERMCFLSISYLPPHFDGCFRYSTSKTTPRRPLRVSLLSSDCRSRVRYYNRRELRRKLFLLYSSDPRFAPRVHDVHGSRGVYVSLHISAPREPPHKLPPYYMFEKHVFDDDRVRGRLRRNESYDEVRPRVATPE